jgi:hypothetical protein
MVACAMDNSSGAFMDEARTDSKSCTPAENSPKLSVFGTEGVSVNTRHAGCCKM